MLYIRTDMNQTIATGHLMRCLAIADAARTLGEASTFLLADKQAVSLLEEHGYPYIVLHTDWKDMESELSILLPLIAEKKIEKLLIDSYQVTAAYLEALTKATKTVYLDDLGEFPYPVDIVICYANYWEKLGYAEKGDFRKGFFGPSYAPLRREFQDCQKKLIKPRVENLLLLSGGTDPYHILADILEQIDPELYLRIDIICGKYHTGYDSLCELYKSYNNIHIHKAVSHIETLMEQADLAVAAGGTTLYELCACGTPTISYAMADNQLENVRQFQEDGIIDYAGDVRYENAIEHIMAYVKQYHRDASLRRERSERMQNIVDGRGAERSARALMDL